LWKKKDVERDECVLVGLAGAECTFFTGAALYRRLEKELEAKSLEGESFGPFFRK